MNKLILQPFVNDNMDDGWYLSISPIISADWTARFQLQFLFPK